MEEGLRDVIVRALWGLAMGLVAVLGLFFVLGVEVGPVDSGAALLAALVTCYGAVRTAGEPPSEIRISWRWTIPVTVASIAWLYGALLMMDSLHQAVHGTPAPALIIQGWPGLIGILAATAFLVFAHELVHWVAFRYYGARPRFLIFVKPFPGAGVYAEGHPLPRRAMLVVALAPVVVLTLAFVVLLTVPQWTVVATWGGGLQSGGRRGGLRHGRLAALPTAGNVGGRSPRWNPCVADR